jgi:hypothetical protein
MYDPKPIDMSDALRQVYEGKKLDPVGQEDKDIDNDGDHDKSDKYLLNRRKVRGKAIKTRSEEVAAVEEGLAKMAADVTDALPWNRNTKYTTKGERRQPGENVHGVQTGRGLNKTTATMGAKGSAGGSGSGGPAGGQSGGQTGGSKLKGSPKGFGWSRLKKEEVEEFVDSLLSANHEEQLDVVLEFIGGRKGDGYIGHPNLDIKNPLAKTQTKGPVGNKTGSGMVHRVGGALGDRKMQMDKLMGRSKGGPVKKENVHVDMVANMLDEMTPGGRARDAVYEPEGDMLKEALVNDLLQLSEEQLNELLGGLVGGLMNMGKKGGFMKGASTGIGGLAGQAMGKKPTTKGLLGFSKGGEKKKAHKEEVIHDELDDIFEGPVGEFADKAARLAGNIVGGTERAITKGPAYLKKKVSNVKSTFDSARERTRENIPRNMVKARKESLAFSEEEELFIEGCNFDDVSDEELVAFFEDAILEMAEDDQDLFEICEELEICGILMEEEEKDDDKKKPSAMDRLKSAAAKAGERLKAGAKAVIGAGGRAIGHGVGEFQAQRKKSKKAAMERGDGKKKKSDDDGDKTGGKLDDILSSIRGDARGESGSGKSGGKSKGEKPTFIQRVGGVLKGALKKGVGKLSRAVSSGSDKLANRLGEDYEQIAHLYESGLFSIQEIEHVIEEGYKEIDKKKENSMYRRAGNLARKSLSADDPDEKEKARKKSAKIVSAIARQKERERFSKMGDEKARDNYGG